MITSVSAGYWRADFRYIVLAAVTFGNLLPVELNTKQASWAYIGLGAYAGE